MDWKRLNIGEGISCELGRLNWRERPLVAAMLSDALATKGEIVNEDGTAKLEGGDFLARMEKTIATLDDSILRPVFREKVRDVQGLSGVTTGEELWDQAPEMGMLMEVLAGLLSDSSLSEEEGKASESPSTSSLEETADTSSPAPSTVPEAGPSHSTVTETRPGTTSSSRVA